MFKDLVVAVRRRKVWRSVGHAALNLDFMGLGLRAYAFGFRV